MPIVLMYLSAMLGIVASMQLVTLPKSDAAGRVSGGYSSDTSSLVRPYEVQYDGRNINQESHTLSRIADTAATRVCRQLSYEMKLAYIAGDATCANYRQSTLLYGFVGTAGTTGSIDTLYSGVKSSTLSCAEPDRYGRYLFSRALPQSMIAGKSIQFNLQSITDGKYDPCGFREIIH